MNRFSLIRPKPALMTMGLALLGMAQLSGCDTRRPSFKEADTNAQIERPLQLARSFVFNSRQEQVDDIVFASSQSQHSLTLDFTTEDVTWTNRQRDRRVQDSFRQGNLADEATESFKNLERSPVDILFVVDNSSSMKEEQVNLSTKLSAVVGHLSEADWRLAVVSTDPNEPCSQKTVISKGSTDPAAQFQAAIEGLGIGGSGTETGFFKAVQGLGGCAADSSWPEGWARAHSAVATVIVSDEDNCSNGHECGRKPHSKPKYLLDYLSSIRTLGSTAKVYGLIKTSWRSCSSAAQVGRQYLKAIKATGGIAGSICDADYSGVLSQLSEDLSETLIHTLNLSHTPIGGDAMAVWVDDRQLTRSDYRILGNTVVLNEPLKPGELAKVRYSFRPKPLKTRFALSQKFARRTMAVTVNGASHHDFNVINDSGVHYLQFDAAPPADAKIVARYHNTSTLKKTFTFDQPLGDIRNLVVSVDGSQTNSYTLEPRGQNTRLTFAEAPADGAAITLSFQRELGRQLRYPVPTALGDLLSVQDQRTGDEVRSWLEDSGQTLVVAEDQFEQGRQLLLTFNLSEGVLVQLPEAVDVQTLQLARAGVRVCEDELVVEARSLDLHACHAAIGDGPLTLSYTRVNSGENYLFAWPNLENQENAELKSVTVTVNEAKIDQFSIEGSGIRFHSPLKDNDRIAITCEYMTLR